MTSFTVEEQDQMLDRPIETRRTVRKFKDEILPRPMVKKVLQASLFAPFAQISVTRKDFRRFVVIPWESEVTSRVAALMKHQGTAQSEELRERMLHDDLPRGRGERYLGVMKMTGQQGPPTLGGRRTILSWPSRKGFPM